MSTPDGWRLYSGCNLVWGLCSVVSLGAVKSEIAEKADDDLDRYASDASFYKPVAAEIRKLPRLVARREIPTEAACNKILRGTSLFRLLVTRSFFKKPKVTHYSPIQSCIRPFSGPIRYIVV